MGCTENMMNSWTYPRNLHLKEANGLPFPDFPAWHWDVLYHQHHATSGPSLYCFHHLVPCQSKRWIIDDLHACFHGNSVRGHSAGAAARNKGHDSEQAQELWMQVEVSAELDIPSKKFCCRTSHTPLRSRILTFLFCHSGESYRNKDTVCEGWMSY